MGDRMFLELRGQKVSGSTSYSWGGSSYSQFMMKTNESISENVGTSNISTTTDGSYSYDFLYPGILGYVAEIDGTIFGNVSFGLLGTGTGSTSVTALTIDILKVDSDGNETSILDGSPPIDILGSNLVADSAVYVYKGVIFWLDVSQARITVNDKILVRVNFTTDVSADGACALMLTMNSNDLYVRLPVILK